MATAEAPRLILPGDGENEGRDCISYLDPTDIHTDSIALMIGKSGAGKTVLRRDIMFQLKEQFHFGVAINGSIGALHASQKDMPHIFTYYPICEAELERAYETIKLYSGTYSDRKTFIILDDCMADQKLFKTPLFRDIAMNSRHYKIFIIICVQYLMDIPPSIREQVGSVFVLSTNDRSMETKLFKYFFGVCGNEARFRRLLSAVIANNPFNTIYLDRRSRSRTLSEVIKIYRADHTLKPYQLCKPGFWAICEVYGRKEPPRKFGASRPVLTLSTADDDEEGDDDDAIETATIIEQSDVYF